MTKKQQGSLTVELGSVNFSLDEVTTLMSHKKKWLQSKGLQGTEENAEAYLREALTTFAKQNPIHIPTCQYSGCGKTRGVKQFDSYEEGIVSLCKKHREMNEGKTGHSIQKQEKSDR